MTFATHDEDSILTVSEHLPAEAAEALLEIATGGKPKAREVATVAPFEHPDAQRRFRVINDVEELARALEFPWDKWTIFLHPAQQELIEKDYAGPARVAGSAGTGKTIVALHRATYLARTNPDARVLLATFSDTLANALRVRLRRLISNEPRLGERIDVHSIDAIGIRLYQSRFGNAKLASPTDIAESLREAASEIPDHKFHQRFLVTEWEQIVDAWQLDSLDAYRNVSRLGRKTTIPKKQQAILWSIFERLREKLAARGLITTSGLFTKLAAAIAKEKASPFDFAVVDEAQDLTVAHLRFFAALGGNRPNSLFFAGDLGQRIFQQPFSWLELGVDIRGRSQNLTVNYRTSHQIRTQSDRLLGAEMSDLDGNLQDRSSTVSVFNGPVPSIQVFKTEQEEIDAVSQWISDRAKEGVVSHEFGVFVRSAAQLPRARGAVEKAGIPFKILDENVEGTSNYASISTMHLAKGLEFRAVVVMACDDEVIPLQERIETVGDDADLQEVYDTERHLLYVACTRARDRIARQEPAQVGKPVQIAQNLAIRISVCQHQSRDATFRAPASRSSQVESSRVHRLTGNRPILEFAEPVFLQIVHRACEPIRHRRVGQLKPIFEITIQIFARRRQFSHHDDKLFLDGQNLFGQKRIASRRPSQTKRGIQFIHATVRIHSRVRFQHTTPVHERSLALVTSLGCDRHLDPLKRE